MFPLPPPVIAEVSDKVPQVPTFWIIAAIGSAVSVISRRHRWARLAVIVFAAAWVGLNALDIMDDPLRREIVIEMGRGYSVHQFATALLPLAFALVPFRGAG